MATSGDDRQAGRQVGRQVDYVRIRVPFNPVVLTKAGESETDFPCRDSWLANHNWKVKPTWARGLSHQEGI
jgi:hypothetical protein